MQARAAKVRINDQYAAVRLMNDRLRQIIRHESLTLGRKRTGNQDRSKRLAAAKLIQPRPKRAELLGSVRTQLCVEEYVHARVQVPVRVSATRPQVIEPKVAGR